MFIIDKLNAAKAGMDIYKDALTAFEKKNEKLMNELTELVDSYKEEQKQYNIYRFMNQIREGKIIPVIAERMDTSLIPAEAIALVTFS